MKTWKEFLEGKDRQAELEKEEERTGEDLDHDDEEGESAEHKAKVFKARAKKKCAPKPDRE